MGRGRRSIGSSKGMDFRRRCGSARTCSAILSGSMPGSGLRGTRTSWRRSWRRAAGGPRRAGVSPAWASRRQSAPARARRAARRRPAPGSGRHAARPALARRATRSRSARLMELVAVDGRIVLGTVCLAVPVRRSAADSGRRPHPRRNGRWPRHRSRPLPAAASRRVRHGRSAARDRQHPRNSRRPRRTLRGSTIRAPRPSRRPGSSRARRPS